MRLIHETCYGLIVLAAIALKTACHPDYPDDGTSRMSVSKRQIAARGFSWLPSWHTSSETNMPAIPGDATTTPSPHDSPSRARTSPLAAHPPSPESVGSSHSPHLASPSPKHGEASSGGQGPIPGAFTQEPVGRSACSGKADPTAPSTSLPTTTSKSTSASTSTSTSSSSSSSSPSSSRTSSPSPPHGRTLTRLSSSNGRKRKQGLTLADRIKKSLFGTGSKRNKKRRH